ncbi:MAG: class I SAM-dependent methyltransferase [Pirellulales bacterium]|nr:class I SAM-dependent methyltransferase [Pirellulales bacterium]
MSGVFGYMRELREQGGPTHADFPAFGGVVRQIGQLHRGGTWQPWHSEGLRRMLGPAFSTETMQGFVYHKPHGYAGDYEIIDRIYQCRVSADSRLQRWDQLFHELPATKAVRNRKSFFIAEMENLYRSQEGPLNVLNVASGPCRDVYELLSRGRPRLAITCLDQDEEAIAYASNLLADYADQVTFVRMNALRCRLNAQFDVVWSAGLFDYFTDRLFVRGLRSLYRHVRPGGEMLIGNFSLNNTARDYMEVIGEWFLHHRSAEQLLALADQAGLEYRQIQVDAEPEGVNLFLRVRR